MEYENTRQYHCESLEQRRLLASVSIFSENFEGALPGWYTGYTNNSAQWATVTSGFGNQTAHSGSTMIYCAGTNFDGTSQNPIVPPNTNADAFHTIDLTGDANAFLSFWYDMPAGGSGQLQVTVGEVNETIPVPSAGTAGWAEGFVNLSYEAGSSQTLSFIYTGSGGPGMYIDDVQVYTDTSTETTLPTAQLTNAPSNVTAAGTTPVMFQVEYDDNAALEPAAAETASISVFLAGNNYNAVAATLVSADVQSATSVLDTYSFLPGSGAWDSTDDGIYTIETPNTGTYYPNGPASVVFDTSGNQLPQITLGTFDCRVPGAIDVSVSATSQSYSAALGATLPAESISLDSSNGLDNVSYTAQFYVAAAPTVTASAPGTLIGQMNFQSTASAFSGTPITLDTAAAGLTIPSSLAPGTYSIGVHITSNDPNFPDTNDTNNWASTGTIIVQPVLSNPTVVTVMVLYTQQTENSFGSAAAVNQQINTAIATTNTAFINSDIDVQLQLAYAGEVNYAETGDPSIDLSNLASGEGGLSVVPGLRAQYSADLVSLWTSTTDNDDIGIAYIAGSATDADLGYNVVVATQTDAYTFSHEIGHNFGAGHAVGDSSGENSDNGLYAYSHGWRFTTAGGNEYHDIMSYPPGTTIPYYSNPNVDYLKPDRHGGCE